MSTTTTDLTVANTIAQQIGARAFFMMGTRQKLGTSDSLIFDLRGSAVGVKKIVVKLDPFDTYTVTFYGAAKRGTMAPVILGDMDLIYADSLNQVIEHNTGLRLSL